MSKPTILKHFTYFCFFFCFQVIILFVITLVIVINDKVFIFIYYIFLNAIKC